MARMSYAQKKTITVFNSTSIACDIIVDHIRAINLDRAYKR